VDSSKTLFFGDTMAKNFFSRILGIAGWQIHFTPLALLSFVEPLYEISYKYKRRYHTAMGCHT
jgi:hypothetical protein